MKLIKFDTIALLFLITSLISCNSHKQISNNYGKPKSVLSYGADNTGKTDSTKALVQALRSKQSKIIVPKGTYRLDQTIEITKHLFLEAGVVIIRKKEARNNKPIFYLSSSYSVLEGENKRVQIKSETAIPEGIIKIGHATSNDIGRNVLYAEVKNLTITGPGEIMDQTTTGIHLYSSQQKGDGKTASFFHTISNLVIEHLDYGILLQGMANANSISNITFNRVGNKREDSAFVIKGAMENRIYDSFHHFSRNATTLRIEKMQDNNGIDIIPSFNYIFGIVSEQGGEEARCSDIRAGKHNVIGINCNAKESHRLFNNFSKYKNKLTN